MITVKFKDRSEVHEFQVKFPNIGQMVDIDERKMLMTNGRYSMFAVNDTLLSVSKILRAVDAFATFSVLIPNFNEKFNINGVSNILEMDINDEKVVMVSDAYVHYFLPEYNKVLNRENQTKSGLGETNQDKEDKQNEKG